MEAINQLFTTLQQKVDTITNYAIFFVVAVVGFLLVSSLIRFLFGKKNQLGKAITSAIEVLCLYLICLVIYSFGIHWDIFMNPLPFISMENGSMQIFSFIGADFSAICAQFVKLLMISFLVNLLNSIIPEGKKLWFWLLMRILTVVLVVFVNYGLDLALTTWLPQGITEIAPLILLAVLVLLILLGSLKLIVGAALFVTNPIIGALYTFFFANFIGRALARGILSAVLITALICLLNSLGILTIVITASSLILLIPALLIVTLVWYIIDRII